LKKKNKKYKLLKERIKDYILDGDKKPKYGRQIWKKKKS